MLNGPGECERTLALGDGVHCEVDTLCSLLSLVSHPEWVDVLILEKGCVLEAPSTTTTTPQKAVSKPGDNALVIMPSRLDDNSLVLIMSKFNDNGLVTMMIKPDDNILVIMMSKPEDNGLVIIMS